MKQVILAVLIIFLSTIYIEAQSEAPRDVSQLLSELGLEFLYPIEKEFKFSKVDSRKRTYGKEDFKLKLEDEEILVYLYTEGDDRIKFPHLEFTRQLAHLATNDQESNIYMYDLPEEDGFSWMAEARFTAKKKLNKKQFGTAKAFYKSGRGMYLLVFLDKKLKANFEPVLVFQENAN